MSGQVHKFESAGLGAAPFRFVSHEAKWFTAPGQAPRPGSSCDYCGTAIVHCFHVESADGRRFKVGSECIAKVGDAGLAKSIAPAIRAARHEADARRIAEGRAEVEAQFMVPGRDIGDSPNGRGSFVEYFDWMMRNAGTAGKLRAIRLARKAIAAAK